MPPSKEYDRGVQNGRTEATLNTLADDLDEVKTLIHSLTKQCGRFGLHITANRVTLALISIAVGFLYLALIRGWL